MRWRGAERPRAATPIATLQRPIARCPPSRSARVTIPTGFVKSTIHASGSASARTRSAISSTTGTVRIAFANPPAPVVSWPMHPQASGTVSSRSLAACPPTRSWRRTNDDSVDRGVEVVASRSASRRTPAARACALPSRRPRCAAPRRCRGGRARRPARVRARARAPRRAPACTSTPADDRKLHPFTPVSVTPSTNAFCARKKTTTTGSMTSTVAAIVRFHCTWWSERNCERPIEVTQFAGFSLR